MKQFSDLDTGLKLKNKTSKNKFIKNSRIKEKKEYKGI